MAQYQRPDTTKTLEFPGDLTFTVDVGDVTALQAAQAMAERLESIDLNALGSEGYMTLCNELIRAIDDVLGEGACARINEGQRVNIIHLTHLLLFVTSEIAVDFHTAISSTIASLTETVPED
jgi:hypothetical protein